MPAFLVLRSGPRTMIAETPSPLCTKGSDRKQLRAGLSGKDEETLRRVLGQLKDNVGEHAPPNRK